MVTLSSIFAVMNDHLEKVINIIGLTNLSRELGISRQAIRKWQKNGHMPDSEYSGRTTYALTIEKLTDGLVTYEDLCPKLKPVKKARKQSDANHA